MPRHAPRASATTGSMRGGGGLGAGCQRAAVVLAGGRPRLAVVGLADADRGGRRGGRIVAARAVRADVARPVA